jgi:HlyD family secretion protein
MASPTTKRIIFWGIAVVILATAIAWTLKPRPILVDLSEATEEPLAVTVNEEGKTRVRDVYVVSAPVAGRALRTDLDVGDAVTAGKTVVAEIEPADPAFLDQRARSEAEAEVAAAGAALALARAEVDQAKAELDFARSELNRARRLATTGTISEQAVDDALRAFRTRSAALTTAEASVNVQEHTLERARSRLTSPQATSARVGDCDCVVLRAPTSGRVLEIHRESEGVVSSGDALLSVGDPSDLEIVVEMLSEDAVKVRPGMRTIIEGWGDAVPLSGRVSRVEPFGFTKVSALGIEEQRVNVLVRLEGHRESWQALGHGFRVDVKVVIWETGRALTIPLTALFRRDDGWAVFVEDDGYARLRTVVPGPRAGLRAGIESGLEAGERVVVSPGDRIRNGVLIASRQSED